MWQILTFFIILKFQLLIDRLTLSYYQNIYIIIIIK